MAQILKKMMKWDDASVNIKKMTDGATPRADFQELREWPHVDSMRRTGRKLDVAGVKEEDNGSLN